MTQEAEDFEARARLIRFANQLVLKRPDLNILCKHPKDEYPILTESLEQLLREREAQGKLFLPNLTAFGNDAIGIFSDYSGEGSGNYHAYSVLACGYRFTGAFGEKVRRIREKFRLGKKEIAFKDFRMGQVRASLPEYLDAADAMPGFLCTVVVDKRIATLFGPQDRETSLKLVHLLEEIGLGKWKAAQAEKLLRVAHMVAFLIVLLAADGQKIFWMSDNDEICPDAEHHQAMLALLERILSIYARPGVTFPLLGGALPFAPRSVEMNDLLSLADIVAGTIADYLSKRDRQRKEEIVVKPGAKRVLGFLAQDGIGLKKATFVIRLDPEGAIGRGTIEFSLVNPPADLTTVPIFA
jgi:hypothetical protein